MEIALCEPATFRNADAWAQAQSAHWLTQCTWVWCVMAIMQQSHTHSAEYIHFADNSIKVIVC